MKNERKIRWVKLTRKCSGIQSIRINKNVDSTIANVDVSMYPINMVSQWDWWGYEWRCKWDITEITNHMICGFNWKRTIRPRNVIMINHLFCWYPFVFEQTHIIIYTCSQHCIIPGQIAGSPGSSLSDFSFSHEAPAWGLKPMGFPIQVPRSP